MYVNLYIHSIYVYSKLCFSCVPLLNCESTSTCQVKLDVTVAISIFVRACKHVYSCVEK